MGKQGDRFLIILDIDRVFSGDELALADVASGMPEATVAAA